MLPRYAGGRLGISIHVPLAGDDGWRAHYQTRKFTISIHVPLAGDDATAAGGWSAVRHFYPRPPCGGRRVIIWYRFALLAISIHVPLAGDDP